MRSVTLELRRYRWRLTFVRAEYARYGGWAADYPNYVIYGLTH